MTNVRKLIEEMKSSNQDFEWYPTTDEMITVIINSIKSNYSTPRSILDIGAGDCRVLEKLKAGLNTPMNLYAIEKSESLLNIMPDNIILLGTDFDEVDLTDKEVDLIFCNPPYSQFEEWVVKIIRTATTKKAYLIIPQRWKESRYIQQALADRNVKANVVESYDYFDGDRQARAKVDILILNFVGAISAFDSIFDETFPQLSQLFNGETKQKEEKFTQVKLSGNTIPDLVLAYQDELNYIHSNYKALETLDYVIFKELGANLESLKEGLKKRITGLKSKYWKLLFNVYEPISNRLTYKSKQIVLDRLRNNTVTVDFTLRNCYAITSKVIAKSSEYVDEQIVELFYKLANPESIAKYKSNQRVLQKEGWRYTYDSTRKNQYANERETHFKLEYRIVGKGFGTLEQNYRSSPYAYRLSNEWDSYNSIYGNGAKGFIEDLMIIARTLGFDINYTSEQLDELDWDFGKRRKLKYFDHTSKKEIVFCEIKFFKNGNAHIFFNSDFIIALNISVGKILGWVKSEQQASEELDIPLEKIQEIVQHKVKNLQLQFNQIKFLLENKE